MSVRIATFPTQPAAIQTATLDGVSFRLRLTYRYRCAAWYLDLWTLDMAPLLLGQRLSPGWMPNAGYDLPDGPDGFLFVSGADGYARDDLGGGIVLRYYSRAELAAAKALLSVIDPVVIEL
jgi:hypothetical protein